MKNLFRSLVGRLFFKTLKTVGALTVFVLAQNLVQNSEALAESWNRSPSWSSTSGSSERYYSSSSKKSSAPVTPFSPGSNNVGLNVGQVFLVGDLSNQYQNAIGTQVYYNYGVSDIFGFDSSLGYSNHSAGAFSMVDLLTGLRTNLTWYDRVIPYAGLGMGFYKPTFRIPTPNLGPKNEYSIISPVLFGVYLKAGIDLQISDQIFFGTSLAFHDIFSQTYAHPEAKIDSTKGPINVGGNFAELLVHGGVTF